MVRAKVRRSAAQWRELIGELDGSGLGLGEFCRRRRVEPRTLQWWRWRLGLGPSAGPGSTASAVAVRPATKPSFRQLAVATQGEISGSRSELGSRPSPAFELRWSDGLTLAIPQEFEAAALQRLLAVLEAAGC